MGIAAGDIAEEALDGAAFAQGASPDDTLMDSAVEIPLGGGRVWRPTDGGPPSDEPMTLADGLGSTPDAHAHAVVGFSALSGEDHHRADGGDRKRAICGSKQEDVDFERPERSRLGRERKGSKCDSRPKAAPRDEVARQMGVTLSEEGPGYADKDHAEQNAGMLGP